MSTVVFEDRLRAIVAKHKEVLNRKNAVDTSWTNGVYERYINPVIIDESVPLFWRYDLDKTTNPFLLERIGINAALNPGAMEHDGKIVLVCRIEGVDRKSFFAVAESENGIDGFKFRDYPVTIPQTDNPDVNVYDMRLVKHEDGWIYGLFCTERKDPKAAPGDLSSAVAQCGIVRTRDLTKWERLDDLKSLSAQQRNVTLHPEFINSKYALYTRPQDSFIDAGSGGGIGWALAESMEHASIGKEAIVDPREYHTIKESKNGIGPSPIKTARGWLTIAHGVRGTAAGLRYVLYAYLCDLKDPSKVIARPGGYLIAPYNEERVGDVSNVTFCNGAVARSNGDLFIYYASSDTRIHVAKTSIDRMLDYVLNTPEDGLKSQICVEQRKKLIDHNLELLSKTGDPLLKEARF